MNERSRMDSSPYADFLNALGRRGAERPRGGGERIRGEPTFLSNERVSGCGQSALRGFPAATVLPKRLGERAITIPKDGMLGNLLQLRGLVVDSSGSEAICNRL